MFVPQRMTVVTLGARNVHDLRRFYRALGWAENDGSDDSFTTFTLGEVRLALFPLDRLRAEAAPGEPAVEEGTWNGVTLALNVATARDVDGIVDAAIEAGARQVAPPTEREWGGYSGYIADPEGNRWEVVWAPGFMEVEEPPRA
jgi:predicted lactoylglutathione lyase